MTAADFVSRAPGKPPADEAQRKRRIVSIDVSGDAALAKVELDYPKVFFVDYLSLLKIDGEWKIAQKTYTGTTSKRRPDGGSSDALGPGPVRVPSAPQIMRDAPPGPRHRRPRPRRPPDARSSP